MEPDPRRNNGPFDGPDAAMKQYAATTFRLPGSSSELGATVIREALLMAKVDLGNGFELGWLDAMAKANQLDPLTCQLIGGWIIRAHLAGIENGQNKF